MKTRSLVLILLCLIACQSEESESIWPLALQGKTILLPQNDVFRCMNKDEDGNFSIYLDSAVIAKQEIIKAELLEELFPEVDPAKDLTQEYQEISDTVDDGPDYYQKMQLLLNQKMIEFILENPQFPYYNLLQYKENYQIRTNDTLYIGRRFNDNCSFKFNKNIHLGQEEKSLVIYAGDVSSPVRCSCIYWLAAQVPLSELKPFDKYKVEIFSRELKLNLSFE